MSCPENPCGGFMCHLADKQNRQAQVNWQVSVCLQVWEGQNIVKLARMMLGETNPADSKPGSIRGDLCINIGRWVGMAGGITPSCPSLHRLHSETWTSVPAGNHPHFTSRCITMADKSDESVNVSQNVSARISLFIYWRMNFHNLPGLTCFIHHLHPMILFWLLTSLMFSSVLSGTSSTAATPWRTPRLRLTCGSRLRSSSPTPPVPRPGCMSKRANHHCLSRPCPPVPAPFTPAVPAVSHSLHWSTRINKVNKITLQFWEELFFKLMLTLACCHAHNANMLMFIKYLNLAC